MPPPAFYFQRIVLKPTTTTYFHIPTALKFAVFLLIVYYFNIFYLGVVTKGGVYDNEWLAQNLNYLDWISRLILKTAKLIAAIIGLPAEIGPTNQLSSKTASVELWLPCLGLEIVAFWIMYVVNFSKGYKSIFQWILLGFIAIEIVNSARIAVLLYALENNWPSHPIMNHHTLFNLAAYATIILLGWLFHRYQKMRSLNSLTSPSFL